MVAISRLVVFLFVGGLALVALPMALATTATTVGDVMVLAPMFVAIELTVYFVLTLLGNPRMALGSVAGMAILLTGVRFVASAVASVLSVLLQNDTGLMIAWAGNPLSAVLQMMTLVMIAPHVLAVVAPEAMDRDTRLRLSGGEVPLPEPARKGHVIETAPSAGFIQVFGFDELAGVVRKTPGLEGFVILSNEGLVVWRDLPIRIDVEEVSARLLSHQSQLGALTADGGLSRLRRLVLQTRDHLLCVVELNANFGLVLVYGARTSLEELDARVEMLARTTREFLQWKYPGLAVTASVAGRAAREAVS
jgi:predicted regulator of Ras-like GTPase activity (Roadblock/LC7/MglB family)